MYDSVLCFEKKKTVAHPTVVLNQILVGCEVPSLCSDLNGDPFAGRSKTVAAKHWEIISR